MIALLLVWIVGICSMYLRSYITMKKRGRSEVIGAYKAVFELASAMKIELEPQPNKLETCDVALLTEEQLRRRITQDLHGGTISFETDGVLDGELPQQGDSWRFGKLLKDNAYCLALLVVFTPAAVIPWTSWFLEKVLIVVVIPFLTLFVMYVGESRESTAVLFWWPVLLFTPVQMIVARLCARYPF
jgi:hypothetical protein